MRALHGEGEAGLARGRTVLSHIELIRVGNTVLDAAGVMSSRNLRSLDAIHLATAQLIGSDLDVFIAYDERLLDAARSAGLHTASPD